MKYMLVIGCMVLLSWACQSRKGSAEDSSAGSALSGAETQKRDAWVYFRNLTEGDVVTSPFVVEMGIEGMEIEPAGEVREGYGHHHILINQTHWEDGSIIPQSDTTIHYGQGETEATLNLAPGNYLLSLQFADGVHASYGEALAASVRIQVAETADAN